ncbi:MAG: hypothetical protein JNK10_08165 [Cyclobacteriaceae bacterium]|nr:hypothetical protein [Cyclobacteriaceae bacterium]
MRTRNWILPMIMLLLGCTPLLAQKAVKINGSFQPDSASVGEEIVYTLTARYPRNQQVLFPDSTYSFNPFEFSKRKYFPTVTTGDISYDSAVYFLSTYEIDSVQKLMLPVFIVQERDCVAVFSSPDSILFREKVTMALDSIAVDKLPLKIETTYEAVQWMFNYPILVGMMIGLIIIAIIVWVIFGKRIKKYFAIRKLHRDYNAFISRFTQMMGDMNTGFSHQGAEEALVLWKRYMEALESYPYTKSTSREILRQIANAELGKALRSIDRGIYGGYDTSVEPFRYLQTYSQQQFQKREEEVRNG